MSVPVQRVVSVCTHVMPVVVMWISSCNKKKGDKVNTGMTMGDAAKMDVM